MNKKKNKFSNSLQSSRRQFLTRTTTSATSLWLAGSLPTGINAQPAGTALPVPPWDDVPVCTASPSDQQGQGPFFIHNDQKQDDIDLFRQDIRGQYNPDAEPGTDMHLHLRILDASNDDCSAEPRPVSGIAVYIWAVDAQGFYSGFGEPGEQNPDQPYRGRPGPNDLDNTDRFCRGAGITDENGVVSFLSYFPGWYNGRDLHIHFMALEPDAPPGGGMWYRGEGHIFTTQFYFEPELIDKVHKASEPYRRRTTLAAYEGAIKGDERGTSGLRAKASFDESANKLVVAQMQIGLDPAGQQEAPGRPGFPGGFRFNQ